MHFCGKKIKKVFIIGNFGVTCIFVFCVGQNLDQFRGGTWQHLQLKGEVVQTYLEYSRVTSWHENSKVKIAKRCKFGDHAKGLLTIPEA